MLLLKFRNKNAFSTFINIQLVFLLQTIIQSKEVSTRIGAEFTTEQPPCSSTETIIYPKRGQTDKSDWVFILQGPVQQGIKVEKCLK